MKILKLKRTFFEGWKNFIRNGWLSFAVTTVLMLALYVVSVTVIVGMVGQAFLKNLEKNINVSIYFNDDAPEEEIQQLKAQMEKASDIASVKYVSPQAALDQLLESEKDNPDIKKSLDAIGSNPLQASLVVRATDSLKYGEIVQKIENSPYKSIINRINYKKNKEIIERLSRLIATVQKVGLSIGAVFLLVSILITFNTIRLTLYSRKTEFEIMRLVGASNLYIKMPSIFEGLFYGLFASLITILLLFATVYYIASLLNSGQAQEGGFLVQMFSTAPSYLGSADSKDFYVLQVWRIALAVVVLGIGLGMFGSWIAIKRYLKV